MKLIKLSEMKLDGYRPLKYVFESHAKEGVKLQLKPRDKMCSDCAMTGFYNEIADELMKEDIETQDNVLKSWFCHCETRSMCKGVYNYIHMKRRASNDTF